MDLRRLRFSEQVPSAPAADTRRLRGLPPSFGRPITESAIDGLMKRAEAAARALSERGDARGAAMLRREIELLRRADALCTHASGVETLVQIYRALLVLRGEDAEGVGVEEDSAGAHGPAVRETTALRNRAFRLLEAALARRAPR